MIHWWKIETDLLKTRSSWVTDQHKILKTQAQEVSLLLKTMIMDQPMPECLENWYIATCRLDKAIKS